MLRDVCWSCLSRVRNDPYLEITFQTEYRFGAVFAMLVEGLDPKRFEYGYRMIGVCQPEVGHRFDAEKILLDPYAKAISGRSVWKASPS